MSQDPKFEVWCAVELEQPLQTGCMLTFSPAATEKKSVNHVSGQFVISGPQTRLNELYGDILVSSSFRCLAECWDCSFLLLAFRWTVPLKIILKQTSLHRWLCLTDRWPLWRPSRNIRTMTARRWRRCRIIAASLEEKGFRMQQSSCEALAQRGVTDRWTNRLIIRSMEMWWTERSGAEEEEPERWSDGGESSSTLLHCSSKFSQDASLVTEELREFRPAHSRVIITKPPSWSSRTQTFEAAVINIFYLQWIKWCERCRSQSQTHRESAPLCSSVGSTEAFYRLSKSLLSFCFVSVPRLSSLPAQHNSTQTDRDRTRLHIRVF